MKNSLKLLLFFLLPVLVGCAAKHEPPKPSENGIYYWKTIFSLTDWDKDFLREHQLEKMYLRLFDVVYELDYDDEKKAVPSATVRFADRYSYNVIPDSLEIIPVIYITQDAILHDHDFAKNLYERVKSMALSNGFDGFKEIQLDCDWTKESKAPFFALCKQLDELLHADNRQTSATIRLHQLRDDAPPVDKGVLMVYNTGSIYDAKSENSIVDADHVRPYFKSKVNYPLPLKVAFSTYGWSRVFDDDGKFVCLLHTTEFNDTTVFKTLGKNRLEVRDYICIEGNTLPPGYIIIREYSPIVELLEVKKIVYDNITSTINGNIIYDLDRQSLSDYSSTDINEILK